MQTKPSIALVLGGGGAHAAYQVGFLRALARHCPEVEFPIMTGVSAGAINAVFLANHSGRFDEAVEELVEMWRQLTIDTIFRTDALSLLKNLFRWQIGLMSGGLIRTPSERGLVDSSPLRNLLELQFRADSEILGGIDANLRRGRLQAVAVTATDYRTGRAVTWVQGRETPNWERTHRVSLNTRLTIDHIMASTALPLFFPAIRVGDDWFGDGGMRQTSPLAPALHLGADRILAVSTRYEQLQKKERSRLGSDHPPPAQIIGTLLGSIFLDLLVQDARNLRRINRLVSKLPSSVRTDLREIKLFMLQPSCNIGELSGELRHHLPPMFNYLVRGLGTHKIISPDWLSLVMFDAHYLKRLMEIGESDAEERIEEIGDLLQRE